MQRHWSALLFAILMFGLTLFAPGLASADTTVSVPATLLPPPGVDTGVDLAVGQQVTITATGLATHDGGRNLTDPDGIHYPGVGIPSNPYTAPDAFLPSAWVGALIGRIGDGSWFQVGSRYEFTVTTPGRLYLAYNDGPSGYDPPDNSGSYTANIAVSGGSYQTDDLFGNVAYVQPGDFSGSGASYSKDFGVVGLGGSSDWAEFEIFHDPQGPTHKLRVSSLDVVGANPGDFEWETRSAGINDYFDSNIIIRVRFTPKAGGSRSATIRLTMWHIRVDQTGEDFIKLVPEFLVQGIGDPSPHAEIAPTSISLPDTRMGCVEIDESVRITNTGSSRLYLPVILDGTGDSADFSLGYGSIGSEVDRPDGQFRVLDPGQSGLIHVQFYPTSGGRKSIQYVWNADTGFGTPTLPLSATYGGTAIFNAPPAANNQSITTAVNSPTGITLTGTDPDGDTLRFQNYPDPRVPWSTAHGTLTGTPPNLTYTPNAGYVGSDSFTFLAYDGCLASNVATVSITVIANTAPVAADQSVTTRVDTPKAITLSATDADSDALTYSVVAGPAHGTLAGAAPDLTYTPAAGYTGADSFTFNASDGKADSNTAAVSITVNPNPPPAPTNLVGQPNDGFVVLNWTPSPGAISYTIKRAPTSGGPYSILATGNESNVYKDTAVSNGTTYYYVVSAVSAWGESPDSSEVAVTPDARPAPPANLVAVAGNRKVALSWTASPDAASYRVWRSTTGAPPYTQVAGAVTGTSYLDLGLTNGTTYYYVVVAQKPTTLTLSDLSNQVSATPFNSPPVVDAGPDQTINATAPAMNVTLNGAASDPDGGPLTYQWTEGGTPLGSAAVLSLDLGLGSHTLTLTVTDSDGAVGTDQVVVNIQDVTPPGTTSSLAGTLGSNGWYRGPVTVTLAATDAASGVQVTTYNLDGAAPTTYSGPFTVSGDGVHTVHFSSRDAAGNVETDRSVAVKIDATNPSVAFGVPTPAPNAAGWNNTDVSIPFTASDATSGVAGTVPAASPLVLTSEGRGVTGTVTATDVAGNSASFTSPAVKIDKTPPKVKQDRSVQPNKNGWNNTAVTITFTATDALSGIIGPATATFTFSQEGHFTTPPFTFRDVAGNTVSVTTGVNIDLTAPTIACPPSQTVRREPGKSTATVDAGTATATDALSGVDTIVGVRSDGKKLSQPYPVGATTILWTATDKAGNGSTCAQKITVN